jgi:hypothetical protein
LVTTASLAINTYLTAISVYSAIAFMTAGKFAFS